MIKILNIIVLLILSLILKYKYECGKIKKCIIQLKKMYHLIKYE